MRKEEFLDVRVTGENPNNVKIDTNMKKSDIILLLRKIIILLNKNRHSTIL